MYQPGFAPITGERTPFLDVNLFTNPIKDRCLRNPGSIFVSFRGAILTTGIHIDSAFPVNNFPGTFKGKGISDPLFGEGINESFRIGQISSVVVDRP